jgi:2-iminobutanoate/2-iminopropanoate deaminase
MKPDIIHSRSNHSGPAALPFSHSVATGGLIFVSGQASTDDTGAIVSDNFEGEFRRSMENLRKVLEEAGSDLGHVVKVTSYVRDPADVPAYNQLYREYFKPPFPARTTLTKCLGRLLFEIDCIAVPKTK